MLGPLVVRLALCLALLGATLANITLVPPAGARYGYGVSEPAKWTKALSARPLALFLHGTCHSALAIWLTRRQRLVRAL